MRHVSMIRTNDGNLFPSQAEAVRHLKARHGELISKLSHRFHQKNFTEVAELLAASEDTQQTITQAFSIQREIEAGLIVEGEEENT